MFERSDCIAFGFMYDVVKRVGLVIRNEVVVRATDKPIDVSISEKGSR